MRKHISQNHLAYIGSVFNHLEKVPMMTNWQSIFCHCSQSLEQSTYRTQDCYLFKRRFQTSFEDLAFQKVLWLTFRLLLLQLFYQCFISIIIIITIITVNCAISLYMYCRRRNTNDCLRLHVIISVHWSICSFYQRHSLLAPFLFPHQINSQ